MTVQEHYRHRESAAQGSTEKTGDTRFKQPGVAFCYGYNAEKQPGIACILTFTVILLLYRPYSL